MLSKTAGSKAAVAFYLEQWLSRRPNSPLVFRLSSARDLHRQIAIAQSAMKEIKDQSIELICQLRLIADTFIAHERMSAVHLMPTELRVHLIQSGQHPHPAFQRDVRVLSAPDHQQLAIDVLRTLQRIVLHSFAEAALMDIGCIEARGPQHVGIHGRAECEMTTDADAQGPKLTSAIWAPLQMVQHRTCVCVEARELLGRLQRIAAIGAGRVI